MTGELTIREAREEELDIVASLVVDAYSEFAARMAPDATWANITGYLVMDRATGWAAKHAEPDLAPAGTGIPALLRDETQGHPESRRPGRRQGRTA